MKRRIMTNTMGIVFNSVIPKYISYDINTQKFLKEEDCLF